MNKFMLIFELKFYKYGPYLLMTFFLDSSVI